MFAVLRKGKSEEGTFKVCFENQINFKSQENKAKCMLILTIAKLIYIQPLINIIFDNYDEIVCQMFIAAQ